MSAGKFSGSSVVTVGGSGDSYYEYLLKQWLQGGRREEDRLEDYREAVTGVRGQGGKMAAWFGGGRGKNCSVGFPNSYHPGQ